MRVGYETFQAVSDPFDRPFDLLGRPQHQNIFRVDGALHAEAAAHIRANDPDPGFRNLEYILSEALAQDVRCLARIIKGIAFRTGVIIANIAARFHGVGGDAVVDQMRLGHMGGGFDGGVYGFGITHAEGEGNIAVGMLPHFRRAVGQGRFGGGDGGQLFIADIDHFGGVLGLRKAFRDHESNAGADAFDHAGNQGRKRRSGRRANQGGDREVAMDFAKPIGGVIIARQNHQHAGRGFGGAGVDGGDFGVGVGAAQHISISLARQFDIIHITSAPGEHTRVFLARSRLSDAKFHSCLTLLCSISAWIRFFHAGGKHDKH